METLPIYQMCFYTDKFRNKGLKFSTELEDSSGAPLFVLPITQRKGLQIEYNEFYLPGEINETYHNFSVIFNEDYNTLIIQENWMSEPILLEIDYEYFMPFPEILLRSKYLQKGRYILQEKERFALKYLGNFNSFLTPFDYFIPLNVLNPILLEKYFDERKMCLVGLTPQFGE